MFSPERKLNNLIKTVVKKLLIIYSWESLFKELIYIFYFHDHLNKHFFKTNQLIIIFGNNISLEILNFLTLFSKKYSFLKLRREKEFKIKY